MFAASQMYTEEEPAVFPSHSAFSSIVPQAMVVASRGAALNGSFRVKWNERNETRTSLTIVVLLNSCQEVSCTRLIVLLIQESSHTSSFALPISWLF